ncbi:MAG: T9SS type A sorting domain-containing protein [Saprospiraceae bacterium]|nr:T9SS type A sorting domain-containing protein [Saprospiraceae bacterium]MBK8450405.1 T9SS type A sorting domain-containing protein [Saprospiraceae bacterium]MBK9222743.1 T9SS type A sorting domain-containing protein [Saprospiraceae bacterium]
MKYFYLLLLVLIFTFTLQSQNYSDKIASLIYTHCSNCHRPGEIGPFPLTNYEEVKDRAASIKYVTEIRYMPPWKPDPGYRNFQHENFLSDEEISDIGKWVDAGMPRGDVSKEPAFPNFPKGSQIGTPDLVVSFTQKYTHLGTGYDEYRYFVLPTNLTEDKELVALEMRPGNPKIVHHTLFWADNSGKARAEDAKTPEYGYSGGSAITFGEQLPGYVPGQKPNQYNNGMSQKIPKGSDLVLQMHFAPSSIDQEDSSSVNLFFAKQASKRTVYSKILLPTDLVNGPFIIPANTVKQFHAVYKIPTQVSLLGIWPHCHMLGKDWEVYALLPNGTKIPLIKIGDWDFNWQGGYYFQKLIVLPTGSEIHAFATYDNTVDNPVNPYSPPRAITWGESTKDEMFYLPLSYVLYQAGDESILLADEDITGYGASNENIKTELNPIFPNPVTDELNIPFVLNGDQQIQINLLDLMGKSIVCLVDKQMYLQGQHILTIKTPKLENGVYMIQLKTKVGSWTQKLLIQKL